MNLCLLPRMRVHRNYSCGHATLQRMAAALALTITLKNKTNFVAAQETCALDAVITGMDACHTAKCMGALSKFYNFDKD